MTIRLFPPGQIVATPNALKQIDPDAIRAGLGKHLSGDWGDMDRADKALNDLALLDGSRLFSAYHYNTVKFWIITEADRSVTTVLMPEDY